MISNGFVIPAGRLSEPLTVSGSGSQPRPSLPVFASMSHAQPTDRPADPAVDRERQAAPSLPPFKHWTTAPAPADAGGGVGAFGNLVLTAFLAIAIGMAVAAIHQEERMAPHERQLLQQRR